VTELQQGLQRWGGEMAEGLRLPHDGILLDGTELVDEIGVEFVRYTRAAFHERDGGQFLENLTGVADADKDGNVKGNRSVNGERKEIIDLLTGGAAHPLLPGPCRSLSQLRAGSAPGGEGAAPLVAADDGDLIC